jgi:hypothetical protein
MAVSRSEIVGHYRELGCTIPSERLVTDYAVACGHDGNGGRAVTLNALFDEWRAQRAGEPIEEKRVAFGTVDWLFSEYKASKAYLERVSPRSRPDYERTMLLLADMRTKKGDRIGDRTVKTISPVSADKIYGVVINGPHGQRLRQGEKMVILCRRAWTVVRRLYPDALQQGRAESMDGRDNAAPHQEDQASGGPRDCLCVRMESYRGRSSGTGRRRRHLF